MRTVRSYTIINHFMTPSEIPQQHQFIESRPKLVTTSAATTNSAVFCTIDPCSISLPRPSDLAIVSRLTLDSRSSCPPSSRRPRGYLVRENRQYTGIESRSPLLEDRTYWCSHEQGNTQGFDRTPRCAYHLPDPGVAEWKGYAIVSSAKTTRAVHCKFKDFLGLSRD